MLANPDMYVHVLDFLTVRLNSVHNHQGAYSATVDGASGYEAESYTSTAKEYDVLLYNATSLDPTKEHQLTVTNVQGPSGSSLDIDNIIVTVGDGNLQYVHESLNTIILI